MLGTERLWPCGKCIFTGREKWPPDWEYSWCLPLGSNQGNRSMGGVPLPSACAEIALFPSRGWLTASVTQGINHHFALAVQGPRQCHTPSQVAGRTAERLVAWGQRGSHTVNDQEQSGCMINVVQMLGVKSPWQLPYGQRMVIRRNEETFI